MLLVVCDSSPLIYLSRLGRFELLRRLYEVVLVPPAVWKEVAIEGNGRPGARETNAAMTDGWLRVQAPVQALQASPADLADLDPGEAEAIQLAIEAQADLAIDEAKGRLVAKKLGVTITGTVGLLARAKQSDLIPSLRAELEKLRSTTAFRISDDLYESMLKAVGESSSMP